MTAEPLEIAGMLAACGGAAVAVVSGDVRVRHAAMLVALLAAPVLLAGDVWDQARFADLRSNHAQLLGAIAGTVAAVAIGTAIFRRFPAVFPVLAFAVLPLRLPVQLGGETSNLLVPLYGVIASAFCASALAMWRGDAQPARGTQPRAVPWLRWVLAVTLVLYALQSIYSEDVSNAIENACFFLVPFAVLFVLLAEVRWERELLLWVLRVVAVVGLVFAAVAFAEYASRDLLLNDELQDANQIHLYFRVNSLFHDPNVLGRYLALIIVALGVCIVWARSQRWIVIATAVAGVLLGAMALTFSLTGFAALIAGLLVVAACRYSLRWAAVAGGLMVVAAAVFVLLGGAGRSEVGPERGPGAETGGRTRLVSGGIDLAQDRPVWGWGSGSFGRAFIRQIEVAKTTTSHSEPITVAAEQGAIGMVAYLALLAVSLAVLLGPGVRRSPARVTVAACYVAMIVHSLGYAGFNVDPATWALLALGIAFAASDPTPGARPAST